MNATAVQPDSVTFTCVATGLPRPDIVWFFKDNNGTIIGGLVAIDVISRGERQIASSLSLANAFPLAAGEYTCVAENVVDKTESSAVLSVHG